MRCLEHLGLVWHFAYEVFIKNFAEGAVYSNYFYNFVVGNIAVGLLCFFTIIITNPPTFSELNLIGLKVVLYG